MIRKWHSVILVLFSFILLFGCASNEKEEKNKIVNLTNTSVKAKVDQTTAEQAKEKLKKMDEVTEVRAINTEKELLVGFSVKQMQRFKIKSIEAKAKKQLQKSFPDHKVHVYSDRKILIEAKDIEERIRDGKVDEKKLTKEIDTLKDLMKGQTTHKDMRELFSN